MNDEIDNVHNLSLDDLAGKCSQETNRYLRHQSHDTRFCFELFRRAILENNETAWQALIIQYRPLLARGVNGWAARHPNFPLTREDMEEFVSEGFERFWKYFTPEKFDKAQSLANVLSYLQSCTDGAVRDSWRKMCHRQFDQELDAETDDEVRDSKKSQTLPDEDFQNSELWHLIRSKSNGQAEFIAIYASINLGLSPREILIEYSELFHNIKEIYQYKANFFARLGRDSDIRDFLGRS